VALPPLRDRKSDLPVLVDDVIEQLGVRDPRLLAALRRSEFIEMLARYRWPGNVRQLRNYLERRIALGDAVAPPEEESLPPSAETERLAVAFDKPLKVAREEWNRTFEARYLTALLAQHGHNVSAAARAAAVNRVHFHRLLRKHGLNAPGSEPPPGD
jgi:DNA-binding NtrC family response regulator